VDVQWWTGTAAMMRPYAPADQLDQLVGQQVQVDVFPPFLLPVRAFEREDLALAPGHEGVGVRLPEPWSAELVRPGRYLMVWGLERTAGGEVRVWPVVDRARVVGAAYREQDVPYDDARTQFDRSGATVGVVLEVEPETALALVNAEHGELGVEVGVGGRPAESRAQSSADRASALLQARAARESLAHAISKIDIVLDLLDVIS
jgi:hypothetical protein